MFLEARFAHEKPPRTPSPLVIRVAVSDVALQDCMENNSKKCFTQG